MSVLIKNMDMPKGCYSCPLYRVFTPSDSKCIATDTYFDRTDEDNVAKTCPLVEVPTPHGRLIDADEFYNDNSEALDNAIEKLRKKHGFITDGVHLYADGVRAALENLDLHCPTVIESEE